MFALFILINLLAENYSTDFHLLFNKISNNAIDHKKAENDFKSIMKMEKAKYASINYFRYPEWVLPIHSSGTAQCISNASLPDSSINHYDFFTGDKNKFYPSKNFLIRDKNKDGLDDSTKKSVIVSSMTEGVVLAIEKKWTNKSKSKSGNYIVIYDFVDNMLLCYSQLKNIKVNIGDMVSPGTTIAEVGRTGTRAYSKKHATSLSVLTLQMDIDFNLSVYNIDQKLENIAKGKN